MRQRQTRIFRRALFIVACCLAMMGCMPEPRNDSPYKPGFYDPDSTSLGKMTAPYLREHPDLSGFLMLYRGRDALVARTTLVQLSERSIDAAYYIWKLDASSGALIKGMLEAADRGVRVRLLLDHFPVGRASSLAAALDSHPMFDVRLFNPIPLWDAPFNVLWLPVAFLRDWNGLHTRLHNKSFVVDGAIAIVGGRNIGDQYFDLTDTGAFRDLDLIAAGPVVPETTRVFDRFWNSKWAVPASYYSTPDEAREHLRDLRQRIDNILSQETDPALQLNATNRTADGATIKNELQRMIWAPAKVVADIPEKVREVTPNLYDQLRDDLNPNHSLLLETAYFVPTDLGLDRLRELEKRGVQVKITTNSLRSTDVMAVHSGYARFRRPLIESGVELFEWRPDSEKVASGIGLYASQAALHSKAYVIDHHKVIVGSVNLDPRSFIWNTEIVYVIDSPELAQQVAQFIEMGQGPPNSWHLSVTPDGSLRWTGVNDDGEEVVFANDPYARWWQKLYVAFLSLLPIEHLL